MTRILVLLLLAFSINVYAQTPQGINYQAVAHDNTGATLNNQPISVRIGIISSSISGPLEWEETHSVTTNSYGLFDLVIGQGTSTGTGNQTSFANIAWSGASHFMKVEVDAGTGYENLGTSQLLSVPYAQHARTVEIDQVDDADADATNELLTGGTLNGTDLEISDAGGTTTIDLSPLTGTGDDWGTQAVVTDATMTGDGTAASPLSASGDDWGTQAVVTDATMTGDGTAASPLSAAGDDWGTQAVVTDATMTGDGTAATPLTVVGDLTDDQTLSYNSGLQTLDISGGNQVTLVVDDADADATNELLTGGTMNGTDLELTDAGGITTIDMSSLLTSDTLPIIKNAANTYVSAINNNNIEMGFSGNSYYNFDNLNRLTLPMNNGNFFMGTTPGGTVVSSGSENFGFGTGALASVTSGIFNTAIAPITMNNLTTGNENVAIGRGALSSTTDGSGNVALGYYALGSAGAGANDNVAIGYDAGANWTGGYQNVYIGYRAGAMVGTGSGNNNIKIGANAGTNDNGGNKLYIGTHNGTTSLIYGNMSSDSLRVNGSLSIGNEYTFPLADGNPGDMMTTDGLGQVSWVPVGGTNIAISDNDSDTRIETEQTTDEDIIRFSLGDATGYPAQEYFRMVGHRFEPINPSFSVFVGEQAGANDDMTSNQGVFVGYYAGNANTSGQSNVGIGMLALSNNTIGGANTAVGGNTLGANVSGTGNTAIGFSSQQASTGDQNTSVGNGSLDGNTTGYENTAVGSFALMSNTTGFYNVGVGRLSFSNAIASNNTGLGYSSGGSTTTGISNTFLGYRAGIGNTAGGFNVVIGSAAGDNSTTGSNNVLIGYNAETSAGNLSNATAIGSNAQVSQNNSVVIGSINGVNGASADANVGLGTTAPQSKLHLVTDGNLLGGLRIEDQQSTTVGASIHFDAFSQDWDIYASNSGATAGGDKLLFRNYTGATDVMAITSANQVGIGTVNPSATLDVVGTLQYADGSESDGAVLTSDGSGNATWKPSRVAFYEGQSLSPTTQTLPQGVPTRLQFSGGGNSLTFNDGGGYNQATYEFIAPVTGVYQFNINAVFAGGTNQTCNIMVMSDIQGRVAEETGVFNPDAANWYSANMSVTVRLVANERISVDFLKASGGNSSLYQDKSSFSGHLIYAD